GRRPRAGGGPPGHRPAAGSGGAVPTRAAGPGVLSGTTCGNLLRWRRSAVQGGATGPGRADRAPGRAEVGETPAWRRGFTGRLSCLFSVSCRLRCHPASLTALKTPLASALLAALPL